MNPSDRMERCASGDRRSVVLMRQGHGGIFGQLFREFRHLAKQ